MQNANLINQMASALKDANEKPYAHVRFNIAFLNWEVWTNDHPHYVNCTHDEAEDLCEKLNYEYMAKEAAKIAINILIFGRVIKEVT